jgi:hypothetical protein
MNIIKPNLCKQLHPTNGQGPFQFAGNEKSNNQGVQAAGEPPRNSFDETAIMFVSHNFKGQPGLLFLPVKSIGWISNCVVATGHKGKFNYYKVCRYYFTHAKNQGKFPAVLRCPGRIQGPGARIS